MILRYTRSLKGTNGSNMEALYNICKGQAEASEFIVRRESAIVGVPISQLKFRKNVLIAAIVRNGEVIIPRGYDMICVGDAVVIVSKITGLHDITDILE
jgi:trk system potassium uptake protein TrkA